MRTAACRPIPNVEVFGAEGQIRDAKNAQSSDLPIAMAVGQELNQATVMDSRSHPNSWTNSDSWLMFSQLGYRGTHGQMRGLGT